MVQEFHVLRCFSCEVFQVQQVKKVNKWSCKVCGQKQSVLKEFGRGSGADCRRHVQKLNAARGAKLEDEAERRAQTDAQALWNDETELDEDEQLSHKPVSRWDKYLSAPQEEAGLTQEGAEPDEEWAESEEGAVVLDRDVLHSSAQRMKRRAPPRGQQRKRRRPGEQDEFGPGYNASPPGAVPRTVPKTVPRTVPKTVPKTVPISPSTASALRPMSKWSTFLDSPSTSGSRISASSMFQSGDDVDLDLDLDWV